MPGIASLKRVLDTRCALSDMARQNTRPSNLLVPRHEPTRAAATYVTRSPVSGIGSDEENIDPSTKRKDKGKGLADMPSRSQSDNLPTPDSDASDDGLRGQKRKRVMVQPEETEDQEQAFNKYFDPNQDPDVRRDIKRRSRLLEREFNGKYR